MAFNFNNQRMVVGNNNSINNGKPLVKANFGARSIDDIREEMNNLKYNHSLSKTDNNSLTPNQNAIDHQGRVNAIKQINGYNHKL